ncbi:lytic starch monooxygenase [Geosmithia morbida]|uniref:Lytic starch monooxygenase n=1 Tax=Geosmithia morbida TaxID=1094350 RepID=A0A9P4YW27_9HYPO|nr:lytic starch monooxygenase [Geosmithia morbida]KAF4122743.1 lytic starch monooxygenase [Geosmithia morbida]
MLSQIAMLAALAATVNAHGYMITPMSRVGLNADGGAGADTCPECTILEPVESWPTLNAAKVAKTGPCGYNERVGVDYNQPGDAWGKSPVQTYKSGDTIDVQWCVDNNGDHGGAFSYRICQDQDLVNKFLDATTIPSLDVKQQLEDCFEKGILPCSDVDGNACDPSGDCAADSCRNSDWWGCPARDAGGCKSIDNAEHGSCWTSIAGGYTVSGKVKLPEMTSEHTLLGFKWNSYETPQVYLNCADIAIE